VIFPGKKSGPWHCSRVENVVPVLWLVRSFPVPTPAAAREDQGTPEGPRIRFCSKLKKRAAIGRGLQALIHPVVRLGLLADNVHVTKVRRLCIVALHSRKDLRRAKTRGRAVPSTPAIFSSFFEPSLSDERASTATRLRSSARGAESRGRASAEPAGDSAGNRRRAAARAAVSAA